MYYIETGEKNAPLMLFLHGGGVSGWMWDKQIQHFTSYHCIVPDLPEHGESKDGTTFSIKRQCGGANPFNRRKSRGKESYRHWVFVGRSNHHTNAEYETEFDRLCNG